MSIPIDEPSLEVLVDLDVDIINFMTSMGIEVAKGDIFINSGCINYIFSRN